MLLPIQPDPDIVVANWPALREQLTPRYNGSLVELCDWARARPEHSGKYKPLRSEWFEIPVSDWKYRREIIVGD
jgi:hypothetical protein